MRQTHRSTRLFAALLLLGIAPLAQAKEHEGWVYNGMTGWGSTSEDGLEDSAMATGPSFGYRWGGIGVDAGYSWLGKYEDEIETATAVIETRARVTGWTLGMNFNHDFDEKWSMQVRGGVFGWDVSGSIDHSLLPSIDIDDNGQDWYAGGSVSWQSSKRSSIGLGYVHYATDEANFDVWGLATEFRF